ncbi:hypothetical protein J0H58_09825 [bacterium]|nr:hypothetical protein [bacterium]
MNNPTITAATPAESPAAVNDFTSAAGAAGALDAFRKSCRLVPVLNAAGERIGPAREFYPVVG